MADGYVAYWWPTLFKIFSKAWQEVMEMQRRPDHYSVWDKETTYLKPFI